MEFRPPQLFWPTILPRIQNLIATIVPPNEIVSVIMAQAVGRGFKALCVAVSAITYLASCRCINNTLDGTASFDANSDGVATRGNCASTPRLGRNLLQGSFFAADESQASRARLDTSETRTTTAIPFLPIFVHTRAPEEDTSAQTTVEEGSKVLRSIDVCWHPPSLDNNMSDGAGPYVSPSFTCPEACPFSQELEDDKCFKACVQAEYCKALHPFRTFADTSTLVCTTGCGYADDNKVMGCLECEAPGVCARCSFWARRSKDGRECKDYGKRIFQAVYFMWGSLVFTFVAYFIFLGLRPITNPVLLQRAEEHRMLCRPWVFKRIRGQPTWKQFPLTTKTDKDDVNGVGVALYFRWMQFLLFVSLLLAIVNLINFHIPFDEVFAGNYANLRWPGKVLGVSVAEDDMCPVSNGSYSVLEMDIIDYVPVTKRILDNDTSVAPPSFLQEDLSAVRKPKVRSMKKVKIKMKAKAKVRPKTKQGSNEGGWELPAGDSDKFAARMTVTSFILYVLIFACSLEFGRRQKSFANRWDKNHESHHNYTVRVSGLPPTAIDPAELRQFFQQFLDSSIAKYGQQSNAQLRVIGVSIAYDFREEREMIDGGYDQITQEIEDDFEGRHYGQGSTHLGEVTKPQVKRSPIDFPGLAKMDSLFLKPEPPLAPGWKEDAKQILETLLGSGYAYVVLSTPEAKRQLMYSAEMNGVQFKSKKLTLEDDESQPQTVVWSNYTEHQVRRRLFKNIIFIAMTQVLWALFYLPYAFYSVSAVAVEGELDSTRDTVLGLLIAVGNTLVTITIERAVEGFGILTKDRRDAYTMVLIFLAMIINTVCDILLVLLVIKQMSADMAVHGTLDQSHYDHILAKELYTLIAPGYLITPYIIAPFFEDIVPYYMGKWLIRTSRGDISVRQAERKLMACEFDITWRYSDLLTNFSICLSLLLFSAAYMYKIMFWLIMANVLVYIVDHYRLLRVTSHTFHVTENLSVVFSYWWCVPTAFLGSITAHWAFEAGWLPGWRGLVYFYMVMAGTIHCVVYVCAMWLLRRSVSPPIVPEDSYEEMCQARLRDEIDVSTYFNVNPVHVVRSWILPGYDVFDTKCIPYAQGKEHLQLNTEPHGSAGTGDAVDSSHSLSVIRAESTSLIGRLEEVRQRERKKWWQWLPWASRPQSDS